MEPRVEQLWHLIDSITDKHECFEAILNYIMKDVKKFSVFEHSDGSITFKSGQLKYECSFVPDPHAFIVRIQRDQNWGRISIDTRRYFNEKKNKFKYHRLNAVIHGMMTEINQAYREIQQKQEAGHPSMQLPPIPFHDQENRSGLIQTTNAAGQRQNIMISSATSSAGPVTQGLTPLHADNVYADSGLCSLSSTAAMNPANVYPNWQLGQSFPQQQPQPQQQLTGASNSGGRPASTSGQAATGNSVGVPPPSMTPQYTLHSATPTAYAYDTTGAWIHGRQQIQSRQTNIPPPMSATYNVAFDPSQQEPPPSQPSTYVHPNQNAIHTYLPHQSQQTTYVHPNQNAIHTYSPQQSQQTTYVHPTQDGALTYLPHQSQQITYVYPTQDGTQTSFPQHSQQPTYVHPTQDEAHSYLPHQSEQTTYVHPNQDGTQTDFPQPFQ